MEIVYGRNVFLKKSLCMCEINLFNKILEFPTFYKNQTELLCVAFFLVLKVHLQV